MVGHIERFNPAVIALKKHWRAGELAVCSRLTRTEGRFRSHREWRW